MGKKVIYHLQIRYTITIVFVPASPEAGTNTKEDKAFHPPVHRATHKN
jgi:hypothetical protein